MLMRKNLPYVVLVSALLCGGTTFAGTSKDDIAALQKASVPMTNAIAAAEKASGGKAIDATFNEKSKVGGFFDVAVISGDKTEHYTVDAMMQTAAATKNNSVIAKLDREGGTEKSDLQAAKVSLSEAVSKAESSVRGKAIEAELEHRDKTGVYMIDVVDSSNNVVKVSVDSMTGAVTSTKS